MVYDQRDRGRECNKTNPAARRAHCRTSSHRMCALHHQTQPEHLKDHQSAPREGQYRAQRIPILRRNLKHKYQRKQLVRAMIAVMSTKTLVDRIRLNRTLSQMRKTMIFQMLLEQGCVTGNEQRTNKQRIRYRLCEFQPPPDHRSQYSLGGRQQLEDV